MESRITRPIASSLALAVLGLSFMLASCTGSSQNTSSSASSESTSTSGPAAITTSQPASLGAGGAFTTSGGDAAYTGQMALLTQQDVDQEPGWENVRQGDPNQGKFFDCDRHAWIALLDPHTLQPYGQADCVATEYIEHQVIKDSGPNFSRANLAPVLRAAFATTPNRQSAVATALLKTGMVRSTPESQAQAAKIVHLTATVTPP